MNAAPAPNRATWFRLCTQMALLGAAIAPSGAARAALSAEALAKLVQTPVGNLISVPCAARAACASC
jgi:hypothetical protein